MFPEPAFDWFANVLKPVSHHEVISFGNYEAPGACRGGSFEGLDVLGPANRVFFSTNQQDGLLEFPGSIDAAPLGPVQSKLSTDQTDSLMRHLGRNAKFHLFAQS